MSEKLPIIYLARHGETAWSVSGQHTGLTDLPLTEGGARNARRLGERLRGFSATKVFTGPLQRDVCPPGESRPDESARGRIAWSAGCARSGETC